MCRLCAFLACILLPSSITRARPSAGDDGATYNRSVGAHIVENFRRLLRSLQEIHVDFRVGCCRLHPMAVVGMVAGCAFGHDALRLLSGSGFVGDTRSLGFTLCAA